jgi:hypothetical protein
MELPTQYIVEKIYSYCKRPTYNKMSNAYNFECFLCNEGKSTGRKKRGFYFVDKKLFYCHNCNSSLNPIEWIKEVTGLTYDEILKEASEFDESISDIIKRKENIKIKKAKTDSLPFDSINLFDKLQVVYHREDQVVIDCLNYIQQRRLDKAINRPRTFYTTLNDRVHKNRLCIPFINKDGKITFYQTRAIYKKDEKPAKYLSKVGGDKSVFGINNIDVNIEYLFIFEGPIDAMFIKNGLAIGGINMTEIQENELKPYMLHKKIWIMDNPFKDEAGRSKIEKLIERGETVFIPPREFREFKDLNELCVAHSIDHIGMGYIVKNSYSGLKASVKLKNL